MDYFLLSKTLGLVIMPSVLFSLSTVIALLCLFIGWRKLAKLSGAGALILLGLAAYSPVPQHAMAWLEGHFPPGQLESVEKPAGLLVLGGAVLPALSADIGQPSLNGSAERIIETGRLAARFPDIPVYFSGGSGSLFQKEHREADQAMVLFEALGIDRSRVQLDSEARNTRENLLRFKAHLMEQGLGDPETDQPAVWLMITSASHMPRAIGLARGVGLGPDIVQPYPVDYQVSLEPSSAPLGILDGFIFLNRVVKELVGMTLDWVQGRRPSLAITDAAP
ncbi:MAG: YdcF family protein [Rhodospirillaceae bacterium]